MNAGEDFVGERQLAAPLPPRRGWWSKALRGVLLFAVVPYVAIGGLIVVGQRSLIFQPTKSRTLTPDGMDFLPHGVEAVTIETVDGLQLHGWLILAAKDVALVDDEHGHDDALVIYFPGNAGHREMRRRDVLEFAEAGVDVLIVDYRGYAENPGSPSQAAIEDDARAVWDVATGKMGYRPDRIGLFGESLGGAVAIGLAAKLSREGTPPRALIVTSTFSSMGDMASALYPAYPFRYLLWDQFDSLSAMPAVDCDVVVIHGTDDSLVPWSQGRRLFDAAREASVGGVAKRWELVPGMGHNDIPMSLVREVLTGTFREQADGDAVEPR